MAYNERIQRQSAIFMVYPNKIRDRGAFWAYNDMFEGEYRKILDVVKEEPLQKMYINDF